MEISGLSLPDRVEKRIYWVLATLVVLHLSLTIPLYLLLGARMAYIIVAGVTLFTGMLAVGVATIGLVLWDTRLAFRPKLYTTTVALTSGTITGLVTGFIDLQARAVESGASGAVLLVFAYLFTYAIFPVRSGISDPVSTDD